MKKLVSLLTLAAALLFGACSTYEEVPATSGDNETTVGFLADIAPREQSRADIDVDFATGLTGTWNGEDKLGVLANDFTKLLQFTYTTDSKAFTGSLTGTTGTWEYRAFYPHNGNAAVSGTTVTVPFSALRTQKGNKYNSEFDIMAADAITHSNAEPGKTPEGDAVKFNLHRITSILALKLQSGAASEKIASVMLTSEKPVASEQLTFTIPSDPNAAYDSSAINPTLVADGISATDSPISIDSKHITVTYADGTAPTADYSETFFNVLPDDSYGDLTFSVCTDKGNAASLTITRSTPVVANWVYTVDETVSFAQAAAPTVEWIGHEDLTTPTELLESGNSADIRVSAPGGIKSMQVEIIAPILTESGLLEIIGLAPVMELTNPATDTMAEMLGQLGFPPAQHLLNQQHVFFQIGDLIDLLADVCAEVTETTNSNFKFTVTDNADQTEEITLQYVKTVFSPTLKLTSADLWTNTASFDLMYIPEGATSVTLTYKKSTDTVWQTATVNNKTATIAPEWEDMTNADWSTPNTVLPYSRIKTGTGIFAGNTYDYILTVDGTPYQSTFKTDAGNVIPDGDMENSNLPCFTQDGSASSTFWGSGNNSQSSSLCSPNTYQNGNRAKCQSAEPGLGSIKVLAAGNLFTGTFKMDGTYKGVVTFGQPYKWSARPSALKLKYHATIGTINHTDGADIKIASGQQDKARIFFCIVDWTAPHTVSSTPNVKVTSSWYLSKAETIGSWDPEISNSTDEGKIIGYGSMWIDTNTASDEMATAVIETNFYDKTAVPTDGNYSLVISCACNAYGDYFNGCSGNTLYVDDFEWVY